MKYTYAVATNLDIQPIYELCKKLVDDYEDVDKIEYEKVLKWIYRKIETKIDEYRVVYVEGKKAGYYHFYVNDDGKYELDDLYIYPKYQNQGLGSRIVEMCCEGNLPVYLYVFIKNVRAVSLYKRLGFKIIQTLDTRYIMMREE